MKDFPLENHAIVNLRHGSSETVVSLTRRLRSGREDRLKQTALLKIWGDNCRFLAANSLCRVSERERRAYALAFQAFAFYCLDRSYPAGLCGMRYGNELLFQALTERTINSNEDRNRLTTSTQIKGPRTVRDTHVMEMRSKVSWTTEDSLGAGVRDFVPLPSVRFHASDVVYHSDYQS